MTTSGIRITPRVSSPGAAAGAGPGPARVPQFGAFDVSARPRRPRRPRPARDRGRRRRRWAGALAGLALVVVTGALAGLAWILWMFGSDLPDYQQLADYAPPTVTRVHAGDGRLLAEYAVERRVFVPVGAIPPLVRQAFISAEDKRFYRHFGVDPAGIVRAALSNVGRLGAGRRPVGASTITQQVAQNFLLSKEVSVSRKIREALLALRMERAYTKDKILELYLNEIYLGFASYGVAAAALNYFNKSLDDLTVAEAAFLAALPKAPGNYHPVRRAAAARARRDYVLRRMAEDGHITAAAAAQAMTGPVAARQRDPTQFARADYFAEEVRRILVERHGSDALYGGGLSVRTSLDPRVQDAARAALRQGLEAYDRRHGWRGPVARLPSAGAADGALAAMEPPPGSGTWRLAAVHGVTDGEARIGLADGTRGIIPLSELAWAREWRPGQRRGPEVTRAGDVLAPGDVVLVAPAPDGEVPEGEVPEGEVPEGEVPEGEVPEGEAPEGEVPEGEAPEAAVFGLRQIPEVSGALLALDPHTGRVLAMTGGYDYAISEFNRATQALRQPGSAFKPFVYMAALENGFTPSTLILDAPFVIDQGGSLGKWKPANYDAEFYGPSTMRLGIEKSRNLMTVRLARTIGMERIAGYAERFGVVETLPPHLSMALGAGETTLLRLASAYAMIVNGGRRLTPTLIDRVQDRYGRTLYRHDSRPCADCAGSWNGQPPPQLPEFRERVVDPRTAYQMVSMLSGVVERGTGRRIADLDRPLGGKTGTTNDFRDTWFIGFSPDIVAGVYIGFDRPRSLGSGESAAAVAAPVFREFMATALADEPRIPFRIPPGIRLVRVNPESGVLAGPGEQDAILEAFQPGTVPAVAGPVLDGGYDPGGVPAGDGSGIY